MTTAYDFSAIDIDGHDKSLTDYRGKVLLVVNVASTLWQQYRDRGLVVMGFPCDQFGHQEPGDEAEIMNFCSLTYDVDFPMFSKIDVNGANAHPLWKWLKEEKSGLLGIGAIKWNFSKFLVGRDGQVIKRYAPQDTPQSLAKDIEAALA
jgi:glutathione peroxidase